jgi:hypothetical protein
VREGRARVSEDRATGEEGVDCEGQGDPWMSTPISMVELLASAADAQTAEADELERKGSPTCSMYASIAESSDDWAPASAAASWGATGFMRTMSERHRAA